MPTATCGSDRTQHGTASRYGLIKLLNIYYLHSSLNSSHLFAKQLFFRNFGRICFWGYDLETVLNSMFCYKLPERAPDSEPPPVSWLVVGCKGIKNNRKYQILRLHYFGTNTELVLSLYMIDRLVSWLNISRNGYNLLLKIRVTCFLMSHSRFLSMTWVYYGIVR